MTKRILSFVFIAVFLSLCFLGNAYCATDKRKEDVGEVTMAEPPPSKIKSFFSEEWELKTRLNVLFGYDNNVDLNSFRKGSEFFETYLKTELYKALSEDVNLILGYNFLNLAYINVGSASFYKNTASVGMEREFPNKLKGYTNFYFDWVDYPNDDDGNYLGYRYDIGFRDKITQTIYHKFEYNFLSKDYLARDIRDTSNVVQSIKREDVRHGVNYEVGKYFKKFLLNFFYDYFTNDSNEEYLEYYDYDSYKAGSSVTYLFTKKIIGYLSFAHQWKYYDDRVTIGDTSVKADDATYLGNASIFYKWNDNVSLGLNYSYRQNRSEEPSQEYSSSVISTGIFYKF